MRSFHSEDSYEIKGRGLVYSFDAEQIPAEMWDPGQLKGEDVLIDGTPHRVRGVETFCICRSPDFPYRKSFGLLV
jgi:hypothetical protein